MDTIWKEGGMDYKMTSYQCVPTSHNEGLIQIVQEAETICKIQMEVILKKLQDKCTLISKEAYFKIYIKPGEQLELLRGYIRVDSKANSSLPETTDIQVNTVECTLYSVLYMLTLYRVLYCTIHSVHNIYT